MDPGKSVDFPNMMLVLLISTKYFVSVNYVESSSLGGSAFSVLSAEGASSTVNFSTSFSTYFTSVSVGSDYPMTYI